MLLLRMETLLSSSFHRGTTEAGSLGLSDWIYEGSGKGEIERLLRIALQWNLKRKEKEI